MAEAGLPCLRVYSRAGCHLCEELVEGLLPLARGRIAVEVVDVDERPEWRLAYGCRIPVVELRGRVVCEARLDAERVDAAISAAGA